MIIIIIAIIILSMLLGVYLTVDGLNSGRRLLDMTHVLERVVMLVHILDQLTIRCFLMVH